MSFIINLILFLLLLTVIICIHELGHLAAAKFFGVYCFEYSFGMGPVLLKIQGKETQYSIRALPIGGFVSMAGEADGDEAYPDVKVPEGRRLTDIAWWKKIIVMLAGVAMNFVICIVILAGINLYNGTYVDYPKAVADKITEGSAADMAGFEDGDIILKIEKEDGSSVLPKTYMDISSFVYGYSGVETYTLQRGDETVVIEVTPEYDEASGSYMIGITAPQPESHAVNLVNCLYYGVVDTVAIMRVMVTTLTGLFFHGSNLEQLSGPVGIFEVTSQAASMGLATYLFLLAEISLNVGIFNLLPLPVLDGGQVIFTLIEALIRRPLNQKLKLAIMSACWVILIGLMLFVTWNDISRLF